ncbi:hypothetical protein SCAR479_08846 [Seiridium cardinale]|uniref:Xylanolytic transcriptional activator regulatory domain-containing protein n=1 Tax=Seiridium cardinale TaxID=138064 RepID=A0ABR2XL32_9PEZI
MTSLDFIMDMDVDEEGPQSNKGNGSSSTSGTKQDRDLSASDRANPEEHHDRLNTTTKQRRGVTGRHTKSSTTAAAAESSATVSSPSFTARPALARGNSNTSNEEMHRYGSHPSGSGSGGGDQPNRPMGNPPGDVPIKLTPITGRTTKGEQPFSGDTAGYTTNIRRLSPEQNILDVTSSVIRHLSTHAIIQVATELSTEQICLLGTQHDSSDQEGDKASSSRGTPGDNSRRTSTTSASGGYDVGQGRPSSQGPMPQQGPEITSNPGPSYGASTPYHQYHGGGGPPMSPPQPPGRRESYHSTSSGPTGGYTHTAQIPTINQPPNLGTSPSGMNYDLGNFASPRTTPQNALLIVTTGLAPDSTPGLLAPDLSSPWASSDSNFSTPSENSQRRNYIAGYPSPTTTSDWPVTSYVPTYTPTSQGIQSPHLDVMTSHNPFFHDTWGTPSYSTGMIDPSMPLYSEEHHYLSHPQPPFPSVRSPTPPNISSSVQSAESLVTIAAAPHDLQVLAGRFKEQAAFMGNLSGATFLTAVTLPKPARDAIPRFLDVYWKRFDTLFPLVHRRKFELAPDEILRAAMAAMGSQFLEGKEDRLRGNQLHEWAWQEVKRQLQILQWNVSTMQTILLCEIFARFRGKKIAIKPSEPFRSLYSRDSLFSLVMSSPFSQWHPYSTSPLQVDTITQLDPDHSFGSSISVASAGGHTAATPTPRWPEWIEAEARRRLLAACFVLDVHTSVYYDLPLMQTFTTPCPPIPLTAATQALWDATPDEWDVIMSASPATLEPAILSDDIISAERIANAPPLDQAVFLASEALRMPKRSGSPTDLFKSPDLENVERILTLFPGSGIAYTYTTLHFTPLHDLLAVSGDSWLFSQKVLEHKAFNQHQKSLKHWSGSHHAAIAAKFAAKTLITFLTINDNNAPTTTTTGSSSSTKKWNMTDVSDYWAIYVCALICWALGHRGTGTTTATDTAAGPSASSSRTGGHNNNNSNANIAERESELEALGWLHLVAGLTNPQDILTKVNIRGRGVVIAVVGMVRRRLEGEAAGSRSRLLIDAVSVLKKLEEGINWKWF